MPDVVAAADVILSRAGANSIWEAAVLLKPMVLVPLCGNGTRGDQVDNAEFFKSKGAAEVLVGAEADTEHLMAALTNMLDDNQIARVLSESIPLEDKLKKLHTDINVYPGHYDITTLDYELKNNPYLK